MGSKKQVLRVGGSAPPLPGAVDAVQVAIRDQDDEMKTRKLGADITVDLETLRGLLADQAAQINETQRSCLSQAIAGLRSDFEAHRDELKRDLHGTSVRVTAVAQKLTFMQERLVKLEAGERTANDAGQASGDDRHKYTLVYGGWPKDSSRKDILSLLGQAFDRLELTNLLDTQAFTTTPRRSMALQTFLVRPGRRTSR